jgi:hypothetical protein
VYLLRGTDWIAVYNSGYLSVSRVNNALYVQLCRPWLTSNTSHYNYRIVTKFNAVPSTLPSVQLLRPTSRATCRPVKLKSSLRFISPGPRNLVAGRNAFVHSTLACYKLELDAQVSRLKWNSGQTLHTKKALTSIHRLRQSEVTANIHAETQLCEYCNHVLLLIINKVNNTIAS